MRNKILILSFTLLLSIKVKAHLIWNCKSDSTISYSWQNGNWSPFEKQINYYDFDGNIIETITQGFETINFSWINLNKTNFKYVKNGNVFLDSIVINYTWNNSSWDSVTKTVKSYTPDFNLASQTNYNWANIWEPTDKTIWLAPDNLLNEDRLVEVWNNNAWVNSSLTYLSLDNNNNILVEEYYSWNIALNSWQGSLRISNTYNSNLLISREYSSWELGSWVSVNLIFLQYDINNNVSQSITQKYEDGIWKNYNKTDFTYLNNEETSRFKYLWDTTTITWVENFKFLTTYDANMNIIQVESYTKQDTNWIGLFRNSKSYDISNNEIESIQYNWDSPTLSWKDYKRTTTSYNGFDKIETHFNRDIFNIVWVEDKKEIINFDNDSNLISNSNFTWVNTDWQPISKDSFQYDQFSNETMEISYNWDQVNQSWIENEKLETIIHIFEISSALPIQNCNQDSIILISANNSTLTNSWLENSIDIGESSFDLKVQNTGEYSVLIKDQYCTYESEVKDIKIGYSPESPILVQNNNIISTQGGDIVNWYFNGNLISENTNQIEIVGAGDYWAEFIDSNTLCSSVSEIISIITSLNESEEYKINVQPNLVTSTSVINIPENLSKGVEISIYNASGQLITSYKNVLNDVLISNSEFDSGLYFVTFKNNSEILKAKFIVN